jgi:hypothetical protein
MKATHQQFCMVFVAVAVIAAGAASEAYGVTYNVINLTPSGNWSQALAAGGGQQGGYNNVGDHRQAFLWSGSAASGANLHTGAYNESRVNGMSSTQQAGFIHNSGSAPYHAYIWSGSAASGADLHPPSGFSASCATGTNGTKQAGFGGNFMIDTEGNIVITGGGTHALLWNGSPTDYVDLNPSGFYNSVATGISGTQQVGWGQPTSGSTMRALLWSGTPSYINLHPSGYYDSFAKGISGTQQVGMGRPTSTSWNHALLWNGSAESCVDLRPSGVYESCANGTNGTQQVGWGTVMVPQYGEVFKRALVWNGSPTDFFYLPTGGFLETWANGIDEYGNIVGGATYGTGATYAVLWQPIPEPATVSLLALGGLAILGRRRISR